MKDTKRSGNQFRDLEEGTRIESIAVDARGETHFGGRSDNKFSW